MRKRMLVMLAAMGAFILVIGAVKFLQSAGIQLTAVVTAGIARRRNRASTSFPGFHRLHRRVRSRLRCYPAVTPDVELVKFAFRDGAKRGCSGGGPDRCKPLPDQKIGL